MPTSNIDNVPSVIKEALRIRPSSVLDLGVGFGKYGVLLREKLDIEPGRVAPDRWLVTIHGVEAFERYRNPIHTFVYNQLRIEDFSSHPDTYRGYDLVLLIDSLEHLEKPVGCAVLQQLRINNRNLIVSCPNCDCPQGAVNGNEYERHRARWYPHEFVELGGTILHQGFCCVASVPGLAAHAVVG
jgi:hypothetical protein